MEPQLVVFLGILGGGALALVAYVVWGGARRRRALRQIENARIVDGEPAVISGTVRATEATLTGPVSGTPCVAYRVHVRTHIEVEENEAQPPPVVKFTSVAFEIDTRHGVVHVEDSDPEVRIPVAPVIPRKLEREIAFATKLGFEGDTMRDLSFEEGRVEVGSKVLVLGMVAIEGANTYLRTHPVHPLVIARPG